MDKKVLGKGLSALISSKPSESILDKEISSLEINSSGNVDHVKTISILENRFQPRHNYDESKLEDLKESIKEKGILQPILVRKHENGYEVIAGERRLRAAKAIGLEQVPVIIKNVTDREALVLALVENIQREELNAIEEALGYKRLMEEFSFTQEAVAEAIGKDRSTVTNLLRLLRLPEEIQKQVADAKLSMGHARALLSLEDATIQNKMARVIIDRGLSVRQVEDLVKKARQGQNIMQVPVQKSRNRDIEILEEELRRILGTKVFIEDKKGKGKLVVEYYTLDDLDRIFRNFTQMKKQSALVLIKPDGMQKAIAGEVISLFLASDLKLTGMKLVRVSPRLAKAHYGHLREKSYFQEVVNYLMGDLHGKNPVVAMVFTGADAVVKCRWIAGATNPEEANPRSVRGKFGRVTTKGVFENLVHVSSSIEEARREIALWFKKSELLK